jgi:hypothetical protein
MTTTPAAGFHPPNQTAIPTAIYIVANGTASPVYRSKNHLPSNAAHTINAANP